MIDANDAFGKHVLTIKHDDGLYRHLRCSRPDTGVYAFDVVTWPGHLYVGGDIDGFTFSRITDMFEFFGEGPVNAHYWSEKLTNRRQPYEKFDPDSVKRVALESVDGFGLDDAEVEAMRAAISESIPHFDFEHEAHEWLRDFEFDGHSFSDTWEWSLRDFDPHFILSCEAIVWAIREYTHAKRRRKFWRPWRLGDRA